MKRALAVSAAAAALAGLLTAAGPAAAESAAETAAGTAADLAPGTEACASGPRALPSLPPAGGSFTTEGVHDLGPRGLAVGASGSLPVYWTGERLHRVPMPEGYDEGVVRAVNRQGLMAGWVSRRSDRATALFTYRPGATSVRLLAEGGAPGAYDVDVNDAGIVAAVDADGTAKQWRGGQVARTLPLPPDAGPGTSVKRITGINTRGDVIGAAEQSYDGPDGFTWSSFPVLWPADGGPARALPVARAEWLVHNLAEGIDDAGRVTGYVSVTDRFDPDHKPWVWAPPYEDHGSSPGVLAGRQEGTFEAISPTTGVSVGAAMTHAEDTPVPPYQAQLWPGHGPLLALPSLTADRDARARAVFDDDRVGGVAVDASWVAHPVIWTCASRQAYVP
ncbi:hypothetical protein [Streptomyces vilmorinianum]|uniref:hypothetical protein n=1 Tax=Streptomyces vilmorinianum TaxID=3051092 RepID=UPI0010FB159C|nr:hypothetical protein [Streptomyces vilmorinianum]